MEDLALQAKEDEVGMIMKRAQVSMFLNEQRFEFAQRIGKMLSTASMVPTHFRNNLGNCMVALNLSERLGVDVFGLMQTSYVIHGRPGFESKLLIALFNARTQLFIPPLRWEMQGNFPKGKDAGCRAYAIDKETKEPLYGEWIDWDMVEEEGWNENKTIREGPRKGEIIKSKWNTMPGQMFRYRSASFFINAYEPGLKMGIVTVDELEDMIIDVTPESAGATTIPEAKDGGSPYEVKQAPKEEQTAEEKPKEEAPAAEEKPTEETEPPGDGEDKEEPKEGAKPKLEERYQKEIVEASGVPADRVSEFVGLSARAASASPEWIVEKALENKEKFLEKLKQWYDQEYASEKPSEKPTDEEEAIRKEFINLRKPGFATWIFANRERYPTFPRVIQKEVREKYERLGFRSPFPFVKKEEQPKMEGQEVDAEFDGGKAPQEEGPPHPGENGEDSPTVKALIAKLSDDEEWGNEMGRFAEALGIAGFNRILMARFDEKDVDSVSNGRKRVVIYQAMSEAVDKLNQG